MTEIRLRTDKRCIETAAKRTYKKLLKQCFKQQTEANSGQLLEVQIEGLKFFLEQADVKALRRTCKVMVLPQWGQAKPLMFSTIPNIPFYRN